MSRTRKPRRRRAFERAHGSRPGPEKRCRISAPRSCGGSAARGGTWGRPWAPQARTLLARREAQDRGLERAL
eukprot:10953057-Lingulodinium_polyedra.AAC.1